MSDDEGIRVNPTLLVRLQYRVSIPGKGTVTGSLAPEQDPELCRALATVAGPAGDVPVDFGEDVMARLMRLGAVTAAGEGPREVCYESLLPGAAGAREEGDSPPAGAVEASRWVVGSLASAPVDTTHLAVVAPHPDPDAPILWVEGRRTGLWFPYWTDADTAARLDGRAGGEGDALADLFRGLVADLPDAGAAEPADAERAGADDPAGVDVWSGAYRADRVAVMRGVLPAAQLRALQRYVSDLHAQGLFWLDDGQVKGREFIHNEPLMRFFNHQLAGLVSTVVGEPAKASYTYLAHYTPGSELARHVDRSQCRWNVSLVLEQTPAGSAPWPIFVEVDDRAPIEVALEPGDAVLFMGSSQPHWRPPLPAGATATVALFHFVAAEFEGDLR